MMGHESANELEREGRALGFRRPAFGEASRDEGNVFPASVETR